MLFRSKFATHGGLSFAGVLCLLLGSLTLFSPMEPFMQVSRPLIYTMVAMMSAFFGGIVWIGLSSQRTPSAMGSAALAGAAGHAVTALTPAGIVRVRGEEWSARSTAGPIRKGTAVVVTSVKGLKLDVVATEPADRPRTRKPRRA